MNFKVNIGIPATVHSTKEIEERNLIRKYLCYVKLKWKWEAQKKYCHRIFENHIEREANGYKSFEVYVIVVYHDN